MANYVNQTVSAGASMTLNAQDTASGTQVAGRLFVRSDGVASSSYVNSGGSMTVYKGGRAENTVVSSGGILTGSTSYTGLGIGCGSANNTIVHSGARVLGFRYNGAGSTTITKLYDNAILGAFSSAIVDSGYIGNVGSGGVLTATTVAYGGSMAIYGNGSANQTNVQSKGNLYVISNGVASNTQISNGGAMTIYAGARAENTVVSSGGFLTGSNSYTGLGTGCGTANNTIVHSEGRVLGFRYAGAGSTTITKLSNYAILGTFSSAVVDSGYIGNVGSGGVLTATTVAYGGSMTISANGSANKTYVQSKGQLYVVSNGIASSSYVEYGGTMTIYAGARAENTVVSSGGFLTGSNSYTGLGIGCGTANNTVVHSDGRVLGFRYAGAGSTTITKLYDYAILGAFSSAIVDSGYIGNVGSGGKLTATTVAYGGSMTINANGSADKTYIESKGILYVTSNGVASNSYVNSDGRIVIYAGARVENTVVSSGGLLIGSSSYTGLGTGCGTANNTIVHSGGRVFGFRYAGAGSTTITKLYDHNVLGAFSSAVVDDGYIGHVGSGGDMTSTTVAYGGSMTVNAGGFANLTYVNSKALLYVTSNGIVANTYVSAGGSMTIYRGGSAFGTVVSSGGVLTGSSAYTGLGTGCGMINSTTIQDGAKVILTSGGQAQNTVVSAGGSLILSSGSYHYGALNIANGAVVSAYTGTVIDFMIAGKTANASALVNNFSLISGNSLATYSVLVKAGQQHGVYKLAANASSYGTRKTMIWADGKAYGSISAGESFSYGKNTYALSLTSGNLNLTVSNLNTDLSGKGCSQIVAWDSKRGKVGYVATTGQAAPSWAGIWEWSGSEASMWKVVGVGQFSSSVKHDGLLLYNGYGNTFAAWTDLGRGDYGYVSLCHVEGNFQTKALADFDGNGLDDVIIYDEKGSFGIVSDARTYHDVWHVDNAAANVQQLIGAGYFGNADGKSDILVKRTTDNAYFLWHNEDSTFKTWNWSQTYLGTLNNDWEVAAIGDFQGDGIDDIIMWQKSTGYLYAWEDGKASNQRWVGQLNRNQWEIAAVGDYNGDGKDDLLLRELNSGWGGVGYWASGNASNWSDLNARIETNMESQFAVIA